MLILSDHLQQNISSILSTVRAIESFLKKHDELSADHTQQIAFYSAEMALLSLAASDEVDAAGDSTEKMLRHEVASALRQIAIHFLNVQEWESTESIRAYFSTISKYCATIRKVVELPPEEEPTETETSDLQLMPVIEQVDSAAMELIAIHHESDNQYEKLKAEIQALREILAALVFERDHLIHVVCKEIESDYMRELGTIEAEIYHAECEVRYLQRKLEMIQASVNRREEVKTETIDEDLRAQYEEYQKIYEEFVRRIMEAAEFQSRRKKNAKSAKKSDSSEKSAKAEQPKETTTDVPKEADSEEKLLKKLYRQIVKAMHPDLHPNQDEATRELFKRAILAYKDGDLKTLNEIAGTIGSAASAAAEDKIESLLQEKARILTMIRTIRAEIKIVKTRFPYTKKETLDDPEKLAAEKKKLNSRLRQVQQAASIYKSRIAEMEGKYGRSDYKTE